MNNLLKKFCDFIGAELYGSTLPCTYRWFSIRKGKWQVFFEQGWKHKPGVYRQPEEWWAKESIQLNLGWGFIRRTKHD